MIRSMTFDCQYPKTGLPKLAFYSIYCYSGESHDKIVLDTVISLYHLVPVSVHIVVIVVAVDRRCEMHYPS